MSAAELRHVSRPDDTDAIDAARAAFWARWRGEASLDSAARRSQPTPIRVLSHPSPIHPVQLIQSPELTGTHRRAAESLAAWFERCIEKELKRCERCMTPDDWNAHRDWIEEHARASLWDALRQRAASGELRTGDTPCIAPKI